MIFAYRLSLEIARLPAAVKHAALIIGGSLALTLSAKLQVPFWPVPMTMQTMAVLLIGYGFGSRLGALTVLAYLAEGVAGLPVFAGGFAGPAYVAGPTGGFLAGFLIAALFAGRIGSRGQRGLLRTTLAMIAGHALIFVPGVTWLALQIGWSRALVSGLMPFLLGTVFKSGLASALVLVFRKPAMDRDL
jgi:biotin transport system substrate-specific component